MWRISQSIHSIGVSQNYIKKDVSTGMNKKVGFEQEKQDWWTYTIKEIYIG